MSYKQHILVEVDGVELTVTHVTGALLVSITRVVAKDRTKSPPQEITSGLSLQYDPKIVRGPLAIALIDRLKRVAKIPTERCTCDYRYGYSDHATHCQSIHIASETRHEDD